MIVWMTNFDDEEVVMVVEFDRVKEKNLIHVTSRGWR